MRRVAVAVADLVLGSVALFANALWIHAQTPGAAQRDGGQIIGTSVVPASVKVEGTGPPVVIVHGFGAAIDWWDNIAPELAADYRVSLGNTRNYSSGCLAQSHDDRGRQPFAYGRVTGENPGTDPRFPAPPTLMRSGASRFVARSHLDSDLDTSR